MAQRKIKGKGKKGRDIMPGERLKRSCKIEGGVLAKTLSQAAKNSKLVLHIRFGAIDSDTLVQSDLDWMASWLPANSHVQLLKLSYVSLAGRFGSMAAAIATNTAITERKPIHR